MAGFEKIKKKRPATSRRSRNAVCLAYCPVSFYSFLSFVINCPAAAETSDIAVPIHLRAAADILLSGKRAPS